MHGETSADLVSVQVSPACKSQITKGLWRKSGTWVVRAQRKCEPTCNAQNRSVFAVTPALFARAVMLTARRMVRLEYGKAYSKGNVQGVLNSRNI